MDSLLSAKAALLAVLATGDGYGTDLIERIADITRGRITLGQGSVYPALAQLEDEGLAVSHESMPLPERGGRPRRYYRLTPRGWRQLQEDRTAIRSLYPAA